MKTKAELDVLKAQWTADPCWDIEDTEGFEDHKDVLKSFRFIKEVEWENQRVQRLQSKAQQIGCPGNVKLAEYILTLEHKIETLSNAVYTNNR